MIRRLKRQAKLNRRIRRYRYRVRWWELRCSLNPDGDIGIITDDFAEAFI